MSTSGDIDGFEVVEPILPLEAARRSAAPALDVRAGLRVALLSNGKANGTELLDAIAAELSDALPGVTFARYRKPSVSVPPSPEDVDEIVRTADAAICAIGDCGSCSSRTMRDAIDLELAGIPSVAVIADALVGPVDYMRRVSGMPDYPFCVTAFPVGNLTPDETRARAATIAPEAVRLLTTGRPPAGAPVEPAGSAGDGADPAPAGPAALAPSLAAPSLVAARRSFAADDDVLEAFFAEGWTDGLPVVAPTADRVAAMLGAVERPAADVVFRLPTRNDATVTVELAAVNAVMAGCRPEYFPLVLAAVEGLGRPEYNLHGHSATLSGGQQVLVVNGPQRSRLGINCGDGALGPGTRANATIGRAVRLVVRNGCRSVHGQFDRSTFGHPGRYSWCFGEGEEASPWSPLSTDLGVPSGTDAVTLYATVWQASTICHLRDAEALLDEIGQAARTACHLNWLHRDVATESSFYETRPFLFVTGRQHAEVLVDGGYDDKPSVQEALFRRLTGSDDLVRPTAVAGPENVHLAYVDGSGFQQTNFFAPFQSHELVTVPVDPAWSAARPDADDVGVARGALAPMASALAADGYELDIVVDDRAVRLHVRPGEEACADCLVPPAVLEGMAADALGGGPLGGRTVVVTGAGGQG